jgi:hypothetical protein
MAETRDLQMFKDESPLVDFMWSLWQPLAKQKSVEILQKIHATTRRIEESKQDADWAEALDFGSFIAWFPKTEKKVNAIASAVVSTNEAMMELLNLVQESIQFICSSIQFAQAMRKTMADMMVNGFKNTNGQMTQLSNNGKKAVQSILNGANDFVTKQRAVEKKQADMYRRIDEIDKVDEEQNQRLEALKSIFDVEREKIFGELKLGNIHKKTALVLSIVALVISLGTLVLFILHFYLQ